MCVVYTAGKRPTRFLLIASNRRSPDRKTDRVQLKRKIITSSSVQGDTRAGLYPFLLRAVGESVTWLWQRGAATQAVALKIALWCCGGARALQPWMATLSACQRLNRWRNEEVWWEKENRKEQSLEGGDGLSRKKWCKHKFWSRTALSTAASAAHTEPTFKVGIQLSGLKISPFSYKHLDF